MIKNLIKKTKYIIGSIVFFVFSAQSAGAQEGLVVNCWDPKLKTEYYNDVNCLLLQAIKIGEYVFSIIGAIALAMFIYGGFTIILSFGNPEKINKGKGIFVAAIIGIIISFSAYALIGFILDALGVGSEFRGVL
ncbi:MAG: hypothetical protein GF349_02550 [Candidatus Magasanikbacteria bacterium]|nr:hypothetical protein [Candidatus Magasanikbacteria bacterium]